MAECRVRARRVQGGSPPSTTRPASAREARRSARGGVRADTDLARYLAEKRGEPLSEMAGQFKESDEIETLARQFVLVRHKRKKHRCRCGGCIETVPTRRPGG